MSLFQGKKIFLLGFLVVLLFAVPLTVYLNQESQQITSQATPATTLAFNPTTKTVNVGETASFDVMMNPGSNQVSFVKLTLTYDGTKFTVDPTNGLVSNVVPSGPFQLLAGPTFNNPGGTTASVSITLSVGSDLTKIIKATTKIATINLKAIAGTSGATTLVGIDRNQTQVLSIDSGDQANEDVLVPGPPAPATVTINGGTPSGGGTTITNKPVCTSLVLDRSATGPAPWTVTFTVSGTGTENNIDKITVTYGDGQVGDITSSGGLGTKSVRAQIAHTYKNAGTYNATAQLSDAGKKLSDPVAACTVAITVTGASSGGTVGPPAGGGGTAVIPTAVPIVTVAPTAIPTTVVIPTKPIEEPGPEDKIIGIGMAGIMLAILGALLLAF